MRATIVWMRLLFWQIVLCCCKRERSLQIMIYAEKKKPRDLLSQEMITWKRQILRDLETDT